MQLSGMKEICNYINRHEDTVLSLIRDEDLPAVKIRGSWESDTDLIDNWRRDLISNRNNDEEKVRSKALSKKEKKPGKKTNSLLSGLKGAVKM